MKITGYGPIKSSSGTQKRGASGSAGAFSGLLDAPQTEETPASAPASEMAAASPLANLLALQEIPDGEIERKKWLNKGKDLLDTLEQIRNRLLTGGMPMAMVQRLSQQMAFQKQAIADPALYALMDDIELRAAVELAKLEMAFVTGKNGDSTR